MKPYARIILSLFVLSSSCHAIAFNCPNRWRELPEEQVGQIWRTESKDKYLVVIGDFNGDGYRDTAKILSDDNKEFIGLFVHMSNPNGSYENIKLDQKKYKYIDVIGIELFEKGTYRERGEKTFHEGDIHFENDSIKYFKYGGAYGVFRWDSIKNEFEFIGLND